MNRVLPGQIAQEDLWPVVHVVHDQIQVPIVVQIKSGRGPGTCARYYFQILRPVITHLRLRICSRARQFEILDLWSSLSGFDAQHELRVKKPFSTVVEEEGLYAVAKRIAHSG